MKQHYKSDFELTLPIRDAAGQEVLHPDFDWEAQFYTGSAATRYKAGKRGGEFTNAYEDEAGRTHVVFDSHGLQPGKLRGELAAYFPNERYPDGYQRVVCCISTDLELAREACGVGEVEAKAELGVIIGGGAKNKAAVAGPQLLQRGIISLGAMEGVVYRNMGYIRVPMQFKGDVAGNYGFYTADADLSKVGVRILDVELLGYIDPDREPIVNLDLENKRLTCRAWGTGLSLRLRIATGDKITYLSPVADGLISYAHIGYVPIDPEPMAPKLRSQHSDYYVELPTFYELAEAVLNDALHPLLEIQSKVRLRYRVGKRHINTRSARWQKRNHGAVIRPRGIFRVRYKGHGRRRPSAWVVVSYMYIRMEESDNVFVVAKPI